MDSSRRNEAFNPFSSPCCAWHTTQPARFDADYDQSDAALKEATAATAQTLPGFTSGEEWQQAFNKRFEKAPAD